MFIRFVTNEISEESSQKLGIFHAIRYMRDDNELTESEFEVANEIVNWFSVNLESPLDFLNNQKSKKSDVYISWFKASAKEHITKARGFSAILENKDVAVEILTTNKPGKIVYEDEFQIFAKPFINF